MKRADFTTAPIDLLVYHRLAPLAFEHTTDERRDALRVHVAGATARDLAMRRALLEVAQLCDGPMLVIKGAATGPMLYGDGALRPREDIDVWVDGWLQAEALAAALTHAGFRRVHQLPGQHARHAISLARRPFEQVDVHAVCARRQRIARALDFGRAWERRRHFELDGVDLCTLCDRHAFVLGATHLGGHHAGQLAPRIVVEDLRLLAERLSDSDWRDVWAQARAHGLLSALRHAAEQLEDWSPGALPVDFARALRDVEDESARFADPMLAVLDDLDLLGGEHVPAYIAELLYPPADYLERQFGIARPRPRALLAGWRVVRGVVARLAVHGHNREA